MVAACTGIACCTLSTSNLPTSKIADFFSWCINSLGSELLLFVVHNVVLYMSYGNKSSVCVFKVCAKVQPLLAQVKVCVCVCVCLQFPKIQSAFMWIIITLCWFFSPPFLTTTSAAEANSRKGWRPNFLALLCLSLLSVSVSALVITEPPRPLALSLIFLPSSDHLRSEPWVDPEPLLSAQAYSNIP